MQKIKEFTEKYLKTDLPNIKVGNVVKVYQNVPAVAKNKKQGKEKKERIQVFEGVVLAMKHGKGIGGTFIVRKIIKGIGVEKTYPLHSPNIKKIEIISTSKVRRAKLYYLRERAGKKAKLKRAAATPIVPEETSLENKTAPIVDAKSNTGKDKNIKTITDKTNKNTTPKDSGKNEEKTAKPSIKK